MDVSSVGISAVVYIGTEIFLLSHAVQGIYSNRNKALYKLVANIWVSDSFITSITVHFQIAKAD